MMLHRLVSFHALKIMLRADFVAERVNVLGVRDLHHKIPWQYFRFGIYLHCDVCCWQWCWKRCCTDRSDVKQQTNKQTASRHENRWVKNQGYF